MLESEIFEYLGSGLKVPTEINGFLLLYRCLFVPETKTRKSYFMLILCSGYAIMLVSEIFEYLGSGLKVPTKINGFLLSIDASLYQKRKIENLILCWFYAQFMLLC